MATFKQIDVRLADALIAFVDRRNLGKSVEIDGASYALDHISHNSSAFFRSRGLSVYFRVDRSVIRISDHWSRSRGFDRSEKLNCGHISGQWWEIQNEAGATISCSTYAGKYPFRMLAGRCGLSALNRRCDHWKG